eukprot:4580292-Amphidinium_carterae.2
MDEREPVGEDGQEVVNRVFMVGTHPCLITHGGSRMTCKKCTRYVTTYKPPPGTLTRGRTKGPNKILKPRILEPAGQVAPLVLGGLEAEVQREFGQSSTDALRADLLGGVQPASSSAGPSLVAHGTQPQGGLELALDGEEIVSCVLDGEEIVSCV